MGFSTPALRKIGYTATDDVIYQDTAVYTNNTRNWQQIITGKLIETVADSSVLRFKCDLKSSGTGLQYKAYMQMLFDGVVVWEETDTDNTYTTYSTDIDMTNYKRNTVLSVEIKSQSVGTDTTSLKNFTLCGKQSPFVF